VAAAMANEAKLSIKINAGGENGEIEVVKRK